MTIIEPSITPFIQGQFPAIYQDEDPNFIAFMRTYYEWLETNGKPLYYARNFLELMDVDTTTNDILVFIKEKYLKNISFSTKANIRTIIKHSLDIYRSKGTERCITLLFQLVFNEIVQFYYPKTDLFRTSDGMWRIPKYIELSLSTSNIQLQHKKIIGVQSTATAFVDDVIRRSVKNRLIDVAYISAIEGVFRTGETIQPIDQSIPTDQCPIMVGSLNSVIIPNGGTGQNFNVGDIVKIHSTYGDQAIARVAEISNQAEIINLVLNDGGYGYTIEANVITSNTIISLSNVVFSNTYARDYIAFGSLISQPMANIYYDTATSILTIGEKLYTYYGNNVNKGVGQILSTTTLNSTAGYVLCSILSGNLNDTTIYTNANTYQANVVTYTNVSANGMCIGANSIILGISNLVGSFILNEPIVSHNGMWQYDGAVIGSGTYHSLLQGNTASLFLTDGVFRNNDKIVGQISHATATITSVQLNIGLINISTNNFITLGNNYVTTPSFTATATYVSQRTVSGFAVSNNLIYTESVAICNNKLNTWTANLNASVYNYGSNTSANASSPFQSFLTFANSTVGKIETVIPTFIGFQIDSPPMVVISEPVTEDMNRRDKILQLEGAIATFQIGEVVTQEATNARGLVQVGSNTTQLYIQELRYNDNNVFTPTVNSTTTIVLGGMSSATANIVSVFTQERVKPCGMNANVSITFVSGNGNIKTLQTLHSGFGYRDNENVWFDQDDTYTLNSGTGLASLHTIGTASGFYEQKGGFLSDQKKLFDGEYYQNYSYEIISAQTIDKYMDMMDKIGHVAGTKMFARYRYKQTINAAVTTTNTEITIT